MADPFEGLVFPGLESAIRAGRENFATDHLKRAARADLVHKIVAHITDLTATHTYAAAARHYAPWV